MEIHRRLPERRPYPAPRKNVLLLSCMDLRLIDDICEFMEGDNLANRYDQLVFAGAAAGRDAAATCRLARRLLSAP